MEDELKIFHRRYVFEWLIVSLYSNTS